ncbi:stage II sporulation protein M [Candidatus Bathyarchaeota archaeon]|nr:stage II sporulation protein M [Candidatus Bathyarchaeota archaeon]
MGVREKDARFCPNCGATLPQPKFWERRIAWTGTLLERIIVFGVIFALCVLATTAGALTKIDLLTARNIVDRMNKIEEVLRTTDIGVQLIFGNNLMYALGMFVPVAGPWLGFYVLYNTGVIISAFGIIYNTNPLLVFLMLFLYPHTWMEYTAYALAISESFWLIYAAVKHRFKDELIIMLMMVVLCNILLLAGAVVEVVMIEILY